MIMWIMYLPLEGMRLTSKIIILQCKYLIFRPHDKHQSFIQCSDHKWWYVLDTICNQILFSNINLLQFIDLQLPV
jgi:hypothetical protein